MGWRSVVIESPCKISCAGNYLIVRADDVKKIHLSEIHYLMIATTNVTVTGVALCELSKRNIKTVFCDEKHNPYAELHGYYGSHNSSKRIKQQTNWNSDIVKDVGYRIIKQKIINQAALLTKIGSDDRAKLLKNFAQELIAGDSTNREGHAAKVFFNTLFGLDFNRNIECDVNNALNYGYTVLLSCINREIVANGCLTQIGLVHINEFNGFNLSCDIIEPFRVIVDEFVYCNRNRSFDKEYKHDLVNLLNKSVEFGDKKYLYNAIAVCVRSVIDSLDKNKPDLLQLYEFK